MIRQALFIKIFLLSSLFVAGNFISSNVYGIECVGVDGCPKQLQRIHRFARFGSPDAQLMLAALYEDGNMVVQSDKKAFKWYKRATRNKGPHLALFKVGEAYLYGKGVSQDTSKSIKFITRAAERHYVNAQLLLGLLYFQGDFVKQDMVKARYWFTQAAKSEKKDVRAAFALGQMLEFGLGGKKDITGAKKWYLVAAVGHYKKALQKVKQFELTNIENIAQLESNTANAVEKGQVLTTYGNNMSEIQMMDLVLENIKASQLYGPQSIGSRIPGQSCGVNGSNCLIVNSPHFIDRLRRRY